MDGGIRRAPVEGSCARAKAILIGRLCVGLAAFQPGGCSTWSVLRANWCCRWIGGKTKQRRLIEVWCVCQARLKRGFVISESGIGPFDDQVDSAFAGMTNKTFNEAGIA
jgi:hypothetical protein